MSQENLEPPKPLSEDPTQAPSMKEATPTASESLTTSEVLQPPDPSEETGDKGESTFKDSEKNAHPKRSLYEKSWGDEKNIKAGQKIGMFAPKERPKDPSVPGPDEDRKQVTEQPPEPTQRRFASYRTGEIKRQLKQSEARIETINLEIDTLNAQIHDVVKSLITITEGTEHFRNEKRLQSKFEQRREFQEQERKKINQTIEELEKELELRENLAQNGQNEALVEQLSLSSIFSEETPIENAMLYAATFFPELCIKDFQSLVALLLQGQTVEVKSTKQASTDEKDDKTQKANKTVVQRSLVEVWTESFCKPDIFLEKCYLELKRDSYSQYVDFVSPNLRDRLVEFFENKQPFYVERMLSSVENLVFAASDQIAEDVALILSEVMVYQPNRYRADWLISMIHRSKPTISSVLLLERVVELLYRVQLRLAPSDSKAYLDEFLSYSLYLDEDLTFDIILYLLYRHLCYGLSEVNGIEAVKCLLNWLKNLLNIKFDDSDDNREHYAVRSLNVIYTLLSQERLWQSSSSNYFYDLLNFLRDWLPSRELGADDYNFLDAVGLLFLPNYIVETLEKVQGERLRGKRKYGVYPPKYPLFNLGEKALLDEIGESRISLLVQWLFYPYTDLDFTTVQKLEEEGIIDGEQIKLIAKFILEWFAILLGFDSDNISQEGSQIATSLLRQIILTVNRSERKSLYQAFAEISDELLDKATEFELQGESQLSKECRNRRTLAKSIRKKFIEQQDAILKETTNYV